ncbi:MAG: arginine--tRNA ligase, partial [bacterium]|nr:arginine--tRNA ligase [bacterium]
ICAMILFMIIDQIKKNIQSVLHTIDSKIDVDITLETPSNNQFGDYSTPIALQLSKQLKKNPLEIAQSIIDALPKIDHIEKMEIMKPGFINFWINNTYLIQETNKILNNSISYPEFHLGKEKKIIVEFAHPNTLKLFHIGHLRNISTGESIVRILETVGNKVIRTNYQGDVGLHIAKCLYDILKHKEDLNKLTTINEKITFIGKMYSEGTKAYETDEEAKKKVIEINGMIYQRNPEIMPLWEETRNWSLKYFDVIYKRLYSHFDRLFFESELYEKGVEIVHAAVKNGILEKSQNAIIFNGKKYGLDTRVFINSLGYPTYEGKELALAEKEFSEFGEVDKCIHVVTPEQTSFFKVTFKVEELLNEKKFKNKQYHLVYEWVNLKEGKMSSREGNIISADWLIDEAKKSILELFKCTEEVAETLAIASVKYSILKNGVSNAIAFDFKESISLEGNSAPYLIYTYVRTQSILRKSESNIKDPSKISLKDCSLEEMNIIRTLYRYPFIVEKAASNFSPNYIATYLFELAQQFNLFYQKYPILKGEKEITDRRLYLTKITGIILTKGLDLLGIKTVEKM